MYAQYEYYHQQAQAQTAVSSQQGLTWNGAAWVATNVQQQPHHNSSQFTNTSSYSSYEPQQQTPAKPASTVIPPKPVEAYTKYYHGWEAHAKECEAYLQRLPQASTERADTQRRLDWAKYYSDQSSRAAHHFFQNPSATCAPFDLPPAPPESSTTAASTTTTPAQASASTTTHNKGSSDDDHTPGSLTRYVKKCLDQCTTPSERKAVQAVIEKAIAEAIQQNKLHSKNWDVEPLIPVPGRAVKKFQMTVKHLNHQHQHHAAASWNNNNNNSKASPHANNRKDHGNTKRFSNVPYDSRLPENDSYYGHGGSTGGSVTSQSQNYSPKNGNRKSFSFDQSNSAAGYYGPASTTHPTGPSNFVGDTASIHSSSSFTSSQKNNKRVVSPEEGSYDYLEFQPVSKKNKSQNKKNNKSGPTKGLDKSAKAMAKRANRFSGAGGISDAANSATTVKDHDKYMGKSTIGGVSKVLDETDFERMTVKGTCLTYEKEYLRLTAPPRAELVRPQPILEGHLANLKSLYKNKNKKRDYLWFCSQLKAIRQDCTVQRIQNEFAIDVYETHGRIALQEGDLNEYNQCQTQLKELYHDNKNSESSKSSSSSNEDEFLAYRLLYYIFLSANEKYDGGSSDMFKIMLSLTHEQRRHPAVAHALQLREAFAGGDYLAFFRLHRTTPNLGRCLTDRIVPTMRLRALRRITKAYRPSVELDFCIGQLGFSLDDNNEVAQGKAYVISCGGVVVDDESNTFMTKDTTIHEPQEEIKNSLI